jgi:Fe-S cluster assembly scaffold protein SufB
VLLDSAIEIQEGTKQIVGRLKERHIFLGEGGKIRGIPALIVHSDDIEASHALAIDRISDEELFYLRSRGFSRDEGTGLLLDGAISEIFAGLQKVDEGVYNECKEKVLGM